MPLSLSAMVGLGSRRFAALRSCTLAMAVGLGCTPHPGEEVVVAETTAVPGRTLGERSEQTRAPFALTASDGTELRLTSVYANVVVDQPLACTQLHLVFENAEDRVIEGRFRLEMPPGAAISRFAMKIGDAWQEAEVVERSRARVVYEDHLHRRRDPALLEHEVGNTFGARVFPIAPGERKEIVVSYSQELTDSTAPYRLALRGLPRLEAFDAYVGERDPATGTIRRVTMRERSYLPTDDLEFALQPAPADGLALRHGELAVARVRAIADVQAAPLDAVTVLFDTSASRAIGFDTHIHRLGDVLAALDPDIELRVSAFDQTTERIFEGRRADFGRAQLEAIASGRALGASDLVGALRSVADDARESERVIVFTDGIATANGDRIADLETIGTTLAAAGIDRIDVVLDAGSHDETSMRALTTDSLPHPGIVVDAETPASVIAEKLGTVTLPPTPVSVPGAAWVWPQQLRGIQSGDDVLVYAQLPATQRMRVELAGLATPGPLFERVSDGPLMLERAWARAAIERLEAQRSALPSADERRARLAREIVDLSLRSRVLSDLTAMLVLESEADYRLYDLERRGLADILIVGRDGIEVVHRTALPTIPAAGQYSGAIAPSSEHTVIPQMARNFDPDMTARNAGILGMVQPGTSVYGEAYAVGDGAEDGIGGLGFVGQGRGGSGERPPVASVRQAKAEVKGAIDKDVIRRIVRAHIAEIRVCYQIALERKRSTRGRVKIQFTISARGVVPVAVVEESTTRDPKLDTCIARAVKRWMFPKPAGGGTVVVHYPFVLESSDRETPTTAIDPQPAPAAPTDAFELPMAPEPQVSAGAEYSDVLAELDRGETSAALAHVLQWRERDAHDTLALVALGEVAERIGDPHLAARAYGSLVDLHPARADVRRDAGARLERLGRPGLALAIDTYEKAVALRGDHPSGHRLLAYAEVKDGRPGDAFATLLAVVDARVDGSEDGIRWERFQGVRRVLQEDLAIVGAAWIAAEPGVRSRVDAKLRELGIEAASSPSTRFVMTWESDANDIDLHVHDALGGHASYANLQLLSGGRLYADVITGFGPECFAIDGVPTAGPYRLEAKYFRRGAMGHGLGKLQIVTHDGHGHLSFDERPFVVIGDQELIELGTWSPM